jgi:hypothetical protein
MAKHSSIVGGSTAARLLNCPGSYQAILKLPPSADISSEYAEEGTAMHAVMTWLMEARMVRERSTHLTPYALHEMAENLIGQTFHDRALTREHVDTMILPALDALAELEKEYGGSFSVVGVELSVTFPGVPGAFGTCDLLLLRGNGKNNTILHVDWKFGQGVGVKALYRDGEGDTVNAQLLYYCAGAINSYKPLYTGVRTLALAIVQPRAAEPLTHTTVSRREVKMFVEDVKNAVIAALDYNPPRQKGEHCRFAPCKIDCPLWTGPMLQIAGLTPLPRDVVNGDSDAVTPYGHYLSRAKTLVDILSLYGKEVNDQLHAYLSAGGLVPGWRLKAKTKNRQWVDEDTVDQALRDLGFELGEIWRSQLVTFASADATAKQLGVKIPDNLRVAPPSTETTVCQTDDPAPVLARPVVIEEFAKALAAMK